MVGSAWYYGRRGGKGPEAWCLVPGSHSPVVWSRGVVEGGFGTTSYRWGGGGFGSGGDAFSNVTAQHPNAHSLPSDGALPFRGATPNGGLLHGTSELKSAGATCRPHRPRLRLKLESTEERLGGRRDRQASWQKGVQDIFQLGLASFLRPTSSRGQPLQAQQQNASPSPIQLCLIQSRPLTLFLFGLFRCVLPRGLVKQVVIHFLFISHRPTFVPASWSVPTTTHISTAASTGWTPKSVPPGSPSNPSIAKKRNIKTCRIDASSIGSRSCLFFLPASCCGRPRTNSTSLNTTLPLPANNTLTACTHHYRDEIQFSRHCLYPPPCVWPAYDNPPVVSPNMAGSGAHVTHSPSSCPSRPRPCFSFRFPPPLPALLPI